MTLGDLQGNYTCFTPNGESVVDFAIVSEGTLKSISYFRILDFIPTLSDCHCRLEWALSANYCIKTPISQDNCNVSPMPVSNLQEKHTDTNENCITPSMWLKHFQGLNEGKEHFLSRINELEGKLKSLENVKCFNELDFPIPESEIADAISKIKKNKSPADDQEKAAHDADESITFLKEIHKKSVSASRDTSSIWPANKTKSKKDQQISQDTSLVTLIDPCVCNGTIKDKNQIRCNFCQEWFYESDDESDSDSNSTASLNDSSFEQNTQSRKPKGTLFRDFNQTRFQLDIAPICVRGGKIFDITAKLLNLPEDSYLENIILQVGSIDCLDKGFQVESFNEEYMTLVMKAKSLSENVVASGLCPRLDDRLGNIHKANDILRKIANDENLYYIDNESVLRLQNGSVNTSLYESGGIHLSIHGTYTVANNLKINSQNAKITSKERQVLISQGVDQIKSQNPKSSNIRHVHNTSSTIKHVPYRKQRYYRKARKQYKTNIRSYNSSNKRDDRNHTYNKAFMRNDFHRSNDTS
ncbi:unnamed protein product [Mytilus edulis]|uniref:Uncharacterized protein n=1 Tax=Mytilus edulis TaxID=6550 RepID=A0A8S3TXQ8_MYTED|nr:unnamed protein product [Mytilus edulis]